MSDFTMSVSMPFNPEALRLLYGATTCESCGTAVALFTICEEEADDGMPISDRPTGEKRWTELADPPAFGVEHTPERCRGLRAGPVSR